MKLTFILPDVEISGGVRVVFEYANRLIERGHNVCIIYPIIPSIIVSESKIKLIGIKLFESFRRLIKGNKIDWFDIKANLIRIPTINPKFINFLIKYVPNSDFIIATAWETAYFVNNLPNEKGEKLYFVQSYEIWDIWNNSNCWKKAREIEKDATKLPIAMSRIVPSDPYLKKVKDLVDATYMMPLKKITISSWLKELLEKRFKQKVYGKITNGVNINEFYCNHNKFDNYDQEKVILVLLRGGSKLKGNLDLLKALDIVKREFKKNKIDIHAFGRKDRLTLPNYIQYHGKVYGEQLSKLYSKAHIFVSPSWLEGCQLPPMEAMATKCAVVATNVGGIPDYTIAKKTAIVVSPQNPIELAKGIIYLLENSEETKRIAKNGYEYIKRFSWEKATNKFVKTLIKCLKVELNGEN